MGALLPVISEAITSASLSSSNTNSLKNSNLGNFRGSFKQQINSSSTSKFPPSLTNNRVSNSIDKDELKFDRTDLPVSDQKPITTSSDSSNPKLSLLPQSPMDVDSIGEFN